MTHGLSTHAVKRITSVLAHYPEIEKAVLYGSRAMGNFRPGSDIDLTLCGDRLSDTLLMRLDNELDDLLLPYRFDLSLFRNLTHPALLEHVGRAGVVFYEKKPIEATHLVNEAASRAE